MSDNGQPSPSMRSSLRRLLALSGRHKTWLFVALAIDLLQAVMVVAQSHVLRGLFDAVTASNESRFVTAWVLALGLGLAASPLSYLRARSVGLFSERTLFAIRGRLAAHLNALPVGYLEERHSGDFLSVLNADLAKLKNLTGSDLLGLIGQASRGLFSLAYILFISWQLTLVSLVLTPLMFVLLARLSAPITRRTNEMQAEIGNLNSVAQDGLGGLPITKSFNLVAILDGRFGAVNQDVVQKGMSIARMRGLVDIIGSLVGFTPFLIAFGLGGYLTVTGSMTFGSIFAFINLLNFVVNPLGNIPRLVANISESFGATERIHQVLDHELERSGGRVTRPSRPDGEVVRFQDVSFAYEAETPVLKGVRFAVQSGETVAIVGPSGSGKSTLIKLLQGFYPVAEGSVFLFGEDIDDWQLSAARQQMALVAQDTYLFPVSVAENILCGKLGAGREEMEAAAVAANIHDTIQALEEGYQTPVGERGARLSGGQRQRVSLARAILKDAPLLLLDEPTSALDSESEALVQEALERLMAGRTSIVIAHRLSTIKHADRVLVLEGGRIVEQGTHDELLARGGIYQELYRKQFDPDPSDDGAEGGGGA